MKYLNVISIPLDYIQDGLLLFIEAKTSNSLCDADGSALENNEARFQLIE